VFLGEYSHALDEKGRVTVPVRLREGLSATLYLTRGQDTHLVLYTQEAWESLATRVRELPSASSERRIYTRWVFGGAAELSLDKAGRMLVPAHLREYAGIDGEVVFVGAIDVVELWSPDRWKQVLSDDREVLGDVYKGVAEKGV
jgi:MraZ protein